MYIPDHEFYNVELDGWDIEPDAVTDAGVPVKDLTSIDRCALTPGHPSPVGRTEDGDLAYVVRPTRTNMLVDRRECAELAHLLASHHGIKQLGDAVPDDVSTLLKKLMLEAVPKEYYDSTSHGMMSYRAACNAVLQGDWENYPEMFQSKRTS